MVEQKVGAYISHHATRSSVRPAQAKSHYLKPFLINKVSSYVISCVQIRDSDDIIRLLFPSFRTTEEPT